MEKRNEHFDIDRIADYVKAELLRRQAEIEQQTGKKPALEDVFTEMKKEFIQVIPGKEYSNDKTPPVYDLKATGGFPGLRKTEFHTTFIPDIPLISHWKHAATVFYSGYSEAEMESLHRLYLDPKFQRISNTLEGRMAIIGYIEGKDYRDYPKEIFDSYSEYYGNLEHDLNQSPENYGELSKAFIDRYGEKYALKWLVHNEPPLPKVFLDPKWLNGISVDACWWEYMKVFIAEDFNVREISQLSVLYVVRELEWVIGFEKFQKLSRTLLSRLDLICSIERCPKERMMKNLNIGKDHLINFEENEELIRERMTEAYGMSYGNLWVAYGLVNGVDNKFVWLALDYKTRFLDRVPALFRSPKNRTRILDAQEENLTDDELSGVEKQRYCLNCGKPIEGRRDKQFCDGGACQRTYYNHKYRRNETLNGLHDEEQQAEDIEPEAEKKEQDFFGQLGELIKGPAGTFLNTMVENGANALSEKMFGKKQEPASTTKPEQNSPPPPKVKIVTGEEIMKRQFQTGLPVFSEAFTKFFGNLHIPFKMLVWGPSGKGKSSFCIKFCNALAIAELPGIYVSAEEDPEGDTMQDKIYLNWRGKLTMKFVNALPETTEQWNNLLLNKDDKNEVHLSSFYIVYDSVTKMEQKPFLADRVQKLFGDNINEAVSHIYIAHAEKDGSTYQGDAGWEYEADIVISVNAAGIATMRKNRFKTATEGLIGGTFDFFGWKIAGMPPQED